MKAVVLVAGLCFAAGAPQRPLVVRGAGPFSATRVASPPPIDGKAWIAATVHTVSDPGTIPARVKAFSLVAADCGDHGGDFQRCHLLLRRSAAAPVRIDTGLTGWVFVTPDGRYVITEPLDVLDVRAWKQYVLSDALGITNYTSIDAISRDGKRLLVSRTDCPMDCREQYFDYYVVRLP